MLSRYAIHGRCFPWTRVPVITGDPFLSRSGDRMRVYRCLTVLLLLAVVSCSDAAEPTIPELHDPIAVTITDETPSVTIGNYVQLHAEVANEVEVTGVTWSSENLQVATVDSTGRVRGKGRGNAKITARSILDPSKSDDVIVAVEPAPILLTITPGGSTITVGDTLFMAADVFAPATGPVRFRSSNPAVAAIDSTSGVVQAKSPGTVVISVVLAADTLVRATALVSVIADRVRLVTSTSISTTRNAIVFLPVTITGADDHSFTLDETGLLHTVISKTDAGARIWFRSGGGGGLRVTANADATAASVVQMNINRPGELSLNVLQKFTLSNPGPVKLAANDAAVYTATAATDSTSALNVYSSGTFGLTAHDALSVKGTVTDLDALSNTLVLSFGGDDGNGIAIYSAGDPQHPQLAASYTTDRPVSGVDLSESAGRVIALLRFGGDGGPAVIEGVDVTDRSNPHKLFSIATASAQVTASTLRNGVLLAALGTDGLAVYDAGGAGGGSLTMPVRIATVPGRSGSVVDVWWFHDAPLGTRQYVLVAEEGAGGGYIHALDVTNLSDPRLASTYQVPAGTVQDIVVNETEGVLHAALSDGGVRTLDLRGDLTSCISTRLVASGPYAGTCMLESTDSPVSYERRIGTALSSGYSTLAVAISGNLLMALDETKGLVVINAGLFKRTQ